MPVTKSCCTLRQDEATAKSASEGKAPDVAAQEASPAAAGAGGGAGAGSGAGSSATAAAAPARPSASAVAAAAAEKAAASVPKAVTKGSAVTIEELPDDDDEGGDKGKTT